MERVKTWWDIANRMMESLHRRNFGLIAAGVAFYSMLAVFPAVAAIIAIWGIVADPAIVDEQLQLLRAFLPASAYGLLDTQVSALIRTTDSALGFATAISTGAAFWSARLGVAALIRGLNASYRAENRAGFRQTAVALVLTGMLIGVGLLLLASVVIMPVILAILPLGPWTGALVSALRWLIAVAAMFFALGALYRYGPNLRGNRPGWITEGGVLALVLWAASSIAFSRYLANFANYNETYGTLGAAVALLMWFYLSAYVVLLGAALNAELRRWRQDRSEMAAGAAIEPTPEPASDEDDIFNPAPSMFQSTRRTSPG